MNNSYKSYIYISLAAVAMQSALSPGMASAQSYPAKPVRLMTGSAPGGGGDLTARAIAQKLSVSLGQQVIVDDRPGATGMIANQLLSQSPPDGYTMLLQPSSFICVSPHLNSQEGWDPSKNVAGIIQVSSYALILVVHPSVPAKTVKELVAIARSKPGILNYASSGVGSNFHVGAEIFKLRTHTNIVHVPYRGSTAAVVDLVAGRADIMFGLVPVLNPYIKEGRLRPIAMTGKKRNPLLPEVPTIADTLPGYDVESWEGIVAPARTPPALVARLNKDIAAAVNSAELRELWKNRGVETVTSTPEELSTKLRDEYIRYGELLKKTGVSK